MNQHELQALLLATKELNAWIAKAYQSGLTVDAKVLYASRLGYAGILMLDSLVKTFDDRDANGEV